MTSHILALAGSAGARKYILNISWLGVEKILRLLAGLLVGVYVARYLGPDNFGTFSYVLAYGAIFGTVIKLGLDSIVVRELVIKHEQSKELLATALFLKTISALTVVFFLALALTVLNLNSITYLYVLIISIGLVFQSSEVVDYYFQSIVKAKYAAMCKILQLAISSAIKIGLVLLEVDLLWFVVATLIDQATLSVAYLYVFLKRGPKPEKNIITQHTASGSQFFENYSGYLRCAAKTVLDSVSVQQANDLLKASWPLLLYSLAVVLNMKSDTLIINWLLGSEHVGLYAAGTRLTEVLYVLPVIIGAGVYPYLTKHHVSSAWHSRTIQLMGLLSWIAIISAIMGILFGEVLINFLYGESFAKSGEVFVIHVIGVIFVFHVSIRTRLLTIENKQLLSLYLLAASLVLNVLLNIALIPYYGLVGAAWASVLAWGANTILFPLLSPGASRYVRVLFESPVSFIRNGFRHV